MLLTAVAALVLTACGDDAGDPGEPSPTATSPTTGPTGPTGPPTDSPAPTRGPVLPTGPPLSPGPTSYPPGEATARGEVIEGVERGCTLLRTDSGGDLLLLGEAAEQVRVGTTVTVRGTARPDLATTCQQGTPFEVSEVVD